MKKVEFIDLSKEIKFMRERYAFFWAAIRSARLDTSCSCIETNGRPRSSCESCLGSGHLFIDKLVKLQRARSSSGIDLLTDVGKVNTSTVNFIISNKDKPKNSDWVFELDLNENNGSPKQPIKIIRSYKIQSVHPCRAEKGFVAFWYCLSEERNFEIGKSVF